MSLIALIIYTYTNKMLIRRLSAAINSDNLSTCISPNLDISRPGQDQLHGLLEASILLGKSFSIGFLNLDIIIICKWLQERGLETFKKTIRLGQNDCLS